MKQSGIGDQVEKMMGLMIFFNSRSREQPQKCFKFIIKIYNLFAKSNVQL